MCVYPASPASLVCVCSGLARLWVDCVIVFGACFLPSCPHGLLEDLPGTLVGVDLRGLCGSIEDASTPLGLVGFLGTLVGVDLSPLWVGGHRSPVRVIRVICVGDPALSSVWVVEQLSPLMGWLSGRPVLWYLGAITSFSFERSLGRDGHRNRTLQPPRGVA